MLALDFETDKIQPGLLAPPIVCGAFRLNETVQLHLAEQTIIETNYFLRQKDEVFVGQNIAYDFGCYLAAMPEDFPLVWKAYEEERVFDIGIAALLNAIYEGRLQEGDLFGRDSQPIKGNRYSLDKLVEEWLGRTDAKANARFRTSYALLRGVPLAEWPLDARQYPIDDVRNTFDVAKAQLAGNIKNLHDMPRQAHAAFCLHLGALWGIRTDGARVEAFAAEVIAKQEALKHKFTQPLDGKDDPTKIYRWKGPKSDPKRDGLSKDTKKLKLLVEEAYLGRPPRTESGGTSTDRVTLEDSGDELLEELAGASKLDKLATYIPALREASTGPLNVEPNVLIATGRSSYKGLIQLMPRKGGVRDCFQARPGHVFCSVDWSAGELSALAQVCIWLGLDSQLAKVINSGKDPHIILACQMTGLGYDEYKKAVADAIPEFVEKRQAGKAGNFGYPGMMGPAKFVIAQRKAGFRVCEWFYRDGQCGKEKVREYHRRPIDQPLCLRCLDRASDLKNFYIQTWEEIPPYWKIVSEMLLNQDDKIEQFISKRVRGGLHAPSGANTLFQGLIGDAMKEAVIDITKEMYMDTSSPLYGGRLLIGLHDESFTELPIEKAHEGAQRQTEIMLAKAKKYMPDVICNAEPALCEYWYKDAKPVFDANKKLIPWQPKEKVAA